MKEDKKWFAVKGLFRWYFKGTGETAKFEERIVLFRANSFDDALDQAELEAVEYCTEDPQANFLIESLKKFSAHEILEKELETGVEILSQRRESSLDTVSYLTKFYPETINIDKG